MKQQVLHVLLAIFILPALIGIGVNEHYCRGHLEKVSVFASPENCSRRSSEEERSDSHHHCNHQGHKDGCCNDQYLFFKVYEQVVLEKAGFEIKPQFLSTFICILYTDLFKQYNVEQSNLLNHSPPLEERDIPVFLQKFLC